MMINSNTSTLAKRSELHLLSRLWHVLCGVIGIVLFYVLDLTTVTWSYIFFGVAVAGFIFDFKRVRTPKLNDKLSKLFGPIMRKSELFGFSGLPFYALGTAFALLLYDKEIAVLSILYLIFADPVASIVGAYFGKDRLLPNKSLQGTIACFTTCLIIGVTYLLTIGVNSPNIILFAFLGAIIGALSEMLGAFNIDDNLTIPVVSGAALTVFNGWLGVV